MILMRRPFPTKPFRLLVWDLDGTLVDSMEDLVTSVNAMRTHRDMAPLPLATVRSYVGCGARNLIEKALEGETSSLDQALAFFLEHYQAHLLDQTRAYPGIPELLENLSGRGIPMAVLTNKPQGLAAEALRGLELERHFQGIYGGDSFPTRKPDPAGLLNILSEQGVAPEEALMIGDSDNDVLTAHHGGLWSLGVTYGYAPQSVRSANPDVTVEDVQELGSLLG